MRIAIRRSDRALLWLCITATFVVGAVWPIFVTADLSDDNPPTAEQVFELMATRPLDPFADSRRQLFHSLKLEKPNSFNSHPTFVERLAAVASFPDLPASSESVPAIELLSEVATIETQLTELLTRRVYELVQVM